MNQLYRYIIILQINMEKINFKYIKGKQILISLLIKLYLNNNCISITQANNCYRYECYLNSRLFSLILDHYQN